MKIKLILLSFSLLIAGCAGKNPYDPYEKYNRKVFAFNDAVDKAILKPVAKGYKKVTPGVVRQGVGNVFANIGETKNIVHNLAQGRVVNFVESTHRFVMNTTFGLLGLFDVTSTFRLPERRDNDMGKTLAFYGWKKSNYFLLPFLPPRTTRDQVGLVTDLILVDPKGYFLEIGPELSLTVVDAVNQRANVLGAEGVADKMALDSYTFQREAYMQYRQNQLYKAGIVDSPDIEGSDNDDDGDSILDIARQNAQD